MRGHRRKLRGLFGVFSAITIAVLAMIALYAMRAVSINHDIATLAAHADLTALEDASELQELLYQKGFAAEYFLTGDERWIAELRRASPPFEEWLSHITADARTPEAKQLAAVLQLEYTQYDADRDHAIAQFKRGDRAGAVQSLVAFTDRAARLHDLAASLIRIHRDEVKKRISEANLAWHRALGGLALAMVLAILGAAASGYLLARRIVKPIYELVLRAESAGGGARVEVTADDEIGALSEHVARLAKRIEESSQELAEHRMRLSQSEKMSALGEMATGVAHELLNPLTGVKAALQLLARTTPIENVIATTNAVDAEIHRVEGMARRLVSFARPLQPKLRDCDADELFQRAVQAASSEAATHSVQLLSHVNGVRTLRADPDLLLQVLVNLTVNACQASSGGAVHLSARRDAGWTIVDIADEGAGIAPDIANRLFTPFATNKPDGHGLGLAVSQNIALAHGGRIVARSNYPAAGTTFSVWLPESET